LSKPKLIKSCRAEEEEEEEAVCSEIHTKSSKQSEHHVEFLKITPGGV